MFKCRLEVRVSHSSIHDVVFSDRRIFFDPLIHNVQNFFGSLGIHSFSFLALLDCEVVLGNFGAKDCYLGVDCLLR